MKTLRPRAVIILCLPILLILFATLSIRNGYHEDALRVVTEIANDLANDVYDTTNDDQEYPLSPQTRPVDGEIAAEPDIKVDLPHHPIYKPVLEMEPIRIIDNFPLAVKASSASDLPPIPPWNTPPIPHVPEATPLFIGFTRNWRLLQQVVVSYITAGWPPEDIYIVENTGVMTSNKNHLLSLQNPFFLNHTRLHMFGVNIILTPTLLSFSQLQNFFTHTAIEKKWATYWWAHMDAIVLSDETAAPYNSLYGNAVKVLREVTSPEFAPHPRTNKPGHWSIIFHAYDQLALVHTQAHINQGGWDTQIPYYMSDCDMHARYKMAGYKMEDRRLGGIWDVASSLEDLSVLYRQKITVDASFIDPETNLEVLVDKSPELESGTAADIAPSTQPNGHSSAPPDIHPAFDLPDVDPPDEKGYSRHLDRSIPKSSSDFDIDFEEDNTSIIKQHDSLGSSRYTQLVHLADKITRSKHGNPGGRNTWQSRQQGGKGEPFYRDSNGFERALGMTIENGRNVFAQKWGHRSCDIVEAGLSTQDAWMVENDWEIQERLQAEARLGLPKQDQKIAEPIPVPITYDDPDVLSHEGFVEASVSVTVDEDFDRAAIKAVCDLVEWNSEVVFTCSHVRQDSNVKQALLQCVRFAIDAGAGLIMPKFEIAAHGNSTASNNTADLGSLFDKGRFVHRMEETCPKLIWFNSEEDLRRRSTAPVLSARPITLEQSQWFSLPTASIRKMVENVKESEGNISIVPFSASNAQYPICRDPIRFANAFSALLPLLPDVHSLSAKILHAMTLQLHMPFNPSYSLSPGSTFLGILLHTSASPSSGPSTPVEQQIAYHVARIRELKLQSSFTAVYISSVSATSAEQMESALRAMAPEMRILHSASFDSGKSSLLAPGDQAALAALPAVRRAQVDYLVLTRARFFLGIADSDVAWAVAMKRRAATKEGSCAVVPVSTGLAALVKGRAWGDELSDIMKGVGGTGSWAGRLWP